MSEIVNKVRWFFIGGWVIVVVIFCIRGLLVMFVNLWDLVREVVFKGNRFIVIF